MNRTKNTLFMLMSLDGKISTGIGKRDVDKDFQKIKGVKEGLYQYYDLQRKTDAVSLNSGKVMEKLGVNKKEVIKNKKVDFVIIDNKHLTRKGVENLVNNLRKLYIITTNRKHPCFSLHNKNLEIIYFNKKIDFTKLFNKLKKDYDINSITIQSGGMLNSILIRENLIDFVSIVIAPCLVGGKETPTLIDGKALVSEADLKLIKSLRIIKVRKLKESYLNLIYEVRKR